MSLSSIPRRLREQVVARDRGRCAYCSLAQFGQGAIFHVDHVIPRSAGGATTLDNLVLQCPHCGLHKSNKLRATDPATGQDVPLFHPLQDRWPSHFILERDGTCTGLTPVGRGTIGALAMNAAIVRAARGIQVMLGLIVSRPERLA